MSLGYERYINKVIIIYYYVAKNNNTLSVLYSGKTWVFDQSESALGPIYITKDLNVHKHYPLIMFLILIEFKVRDL